MKDIFKALILAVGFLFIPTYSQAQASDTTYFNHGVISKIGSYDSKGREKGHWIYYRENGLKEREGNYSKGKYNGKWLFYGIDGEPTEIGVYKKNVLLKTTLPDGSPVAFTTIESMPDYPGGEEAMMMYLANAITYPADAKEEGVEGEVVVSFLIGTEGWIEDINILKSVHPSIDTEVIRIMSAMPQWTPGYQDGKPVKVQYNLPVNFKLPKK
ncbi:TonB family protein [Cryomorpha ignava]|uniref:TonB family protein n=1 Tax=Cryomorpha ignava TaxID=101383 RepID=A0A7K3WUI9_9FLAO|nr:energy transducer TonB [Cryomorpha ignava]NEN25208.1 TonB family protein [Cryomorpha ignava]